MQIFCKETQAHLDMNPHLKEKGKGSSNNLITPDLWMKNCRSRSVSPKSDRSKSSSPPLSSSIPTSPPPPITVASRSILKPLITVAPPSKLMSRPNVNNRLTTKTGRRRRSGRILTTANNSNTNHRINNTSSIQSQTNNVGGKTCTITSSSNDTKLNDATQHRPSFNTPYLQQTSPNLLNMRPPLITPPTRYLNSPSPMPNTIHQEPFHAAPFGAPPPITVLVPYPIIIPLPIPIPIPLPVSEFLKAHSLSSNSGIKTCFSNNNSNDKDLNSQTNSNDMADEQPLDFTKTSINSSREESNLDKLNEKENEDHRSRCNQQTNEITDLQPTDNPGVNLEQKLPKFKITRLNSKRIITPSLDETETLPTTQSVDSSNYKPNTPSKELESSRPLRKRKRIIDGDILK